LHKRKLLKEVSEWPWLVRYGLLFCFVSLELIEIIVSLENRFSFVVSDYTVKVEGHP